MQDLLEKMVSEGYPLSTISKHAEVPYGRLYRCKVNGIELREGDAKSVMAYARKIGVSV